MSRQRRHRHRGPGSAQEQFNIKAGDLIAALGSLLSQPPVALLSVMSWQTAATEEAIAEHIAGQVPDGFRRPTRGEQLDWFCAVSSPETSAALAVMAALADDEKTRTISAAEVALRGHDLPMWLDRLHEAKATSLYRASIPGRVDVYDLILGVELAGEEALTLITRVDLLDGGALTTGMSALGPATDALDALAAEFPDAQTSELDLELGRALLARGIEACLDDMPEPEDDEVDEEDSPWPALLPLLRWATSLLPDGGVDPMSDPWQQTLIDKVKADFCTCGECETDDAANIYPVLLRGIENQVGGQDALIGVRTDPLPDEPTDFAGVPPVYKDQVAIVLEQIDLCATELFDTEIRTAARRFLARLVENCGDHLFPPTVPHNQIGAAILIAVTSANLLIGTPGSLTADDIWDWFGIEDPDSPEHVDTVIGAVTGTHYQIGLGTPDFLTGSYRAALLEAYEEALRGQARAEDPDLDFDLDDNFDLDDLDADDLDADDLDDEEHLA